MSDSGMQIRSDINSVLAQMRSMRASVSSELTQNLREVDRPEPGVQNLAAGHRSEFGTLMSDAVNSVNSLQKSASAQASAFARGESDDLVQVMIAGQKASVGFQALTQVRNRVVSAYQDIMNMPI
jgi:flagellar hook-basal body complex protein FliE